MHCWKIPCYELRHKWNIISLLHYTVVLKYGFDSYISAKYDLVLSRLLQNISVSSTCRPILSDLYVNCCLLVCLICVKYRLTVYCVLVVVAYGTLNLSFFFLLLIDQFDLIWFVKYRQNVKTIMTVWQEQKGSKAVSSIIIIIKFIDFKIFNKLPHVLTPLFTPFWPLPHFYGWRSFG